MATNYGKEAQTRETERLQRILERQLIAAKETSERINRLAEQAKAVPSPPPYMHNRFTMRVQFAQYGKQYEFLLLRVGPRWFTTGTGESGKFDTWGDLVQWVRDNVYAHGPLLSLVQDSGHYHVDNNGFLP